MNGWRAAALAIVALLVVISPAGAFDLQGHRGARGLVAENTIAAFERGIAAGITTIETDLALTKDGVLVISHDPVLNPDIVRDESGRWLDKPGPAIRSLTRDELKRYDVGRINPASKYGAQFRGQTPVDGARIPTLEEVFALGAARGRSLRFNIETKISPLKPDETAGPEDFARAVVAAVRRADVSARVTVQSFDWRTLRVVREMAPDIETSCLTIEASGMNTVKPSNGAPSPWLGGLDPVMYGGSIPRTVKAAGCAVWSPFWRNVDAGAVAETHALGLRVIPWTVNEPAEIARLIDLGVDGLITDFPDRAAQVLAGRIGVRKE